MNRRDHIRAALTLFLMHRAAFPVEAQEDGGLRATCLRLQQAEQVQEQAEHALAGVSNGLRLALAQGQPEVRLRSLAGTRQQAELDLARALREVEEAEAALQAVLLAGGGRDGKEDM